MSTFDKRLWEAALGLELDTLELLARAAIVESRESDKGDPDRSADHAGPSPIARYAEVLRVERSNGPRNAGQPHVWCPNRNMPVDPATCQTIGCEGDCGGLRRYACELDCLSSHNGRDHETETSPWCADCDPTALAPAPF